MISSRKLQHNNKTKLITFLIKIHNYIFHAIFFSYFHPYYIQDLKIQ